MKHLDFVIWTIFFPLVISLCEYIDARRKKMLGEVKKKFSDKTERDTAMILIIVWLVVGYNLF